MSPFQQRIDLTTRARQQEKAAGRKGFEEPDPALPEVSLEDLTPAMKQAAGAMGWPGLMPVQARAIPYILEGRDIIVQSKTGTGKTGAFLLPLFELIDPSERVVQTIILTPTRELARQIDDEFSRMRKASEEHAQVRSVLVYGGVRYGPQVKGLRDGAQVVIGTPGRILDLLERRDMSLKNVRMLVLDEADEMLSMGFYPAMRALKGYLPDDRSSYMFSATIPYRVQQLAEEFLRDFGFLSLSADQVHVDAMAHQYYVVDQMNKDRALVSVLEMENPESAIIFANTKRDVEYLTKFLANFGFNADEISGDLSQTAREAVMGRIKTATLRFLVATDVAARGIDISDLSHVFMYDVPQDPEYYIHRAGRTARAGKTGTAITLATKADERNLQAIVRRYNIDMEKSDLPTPEEVEGRIGERLTVILEDKLRSKSNIDRERLDRFIPLAKQLIDDGEPEVLAMLLDEVYQQALRTPAVPPPPKEERRSSGARGKREGRTGGRPGRNRGRS